MTAPPVLIVENLRKSFGGVEILKGVSLSVAPSQVVGILGRSGSGKSTLLRCINMLETPDSGRVVLDGQEIGFDRAEDGRRKPIAAARLAQQRRLMSMVFQHFNLWPHRTVLGNVVEGPMRVLGLSRAEAELRGLQLLDRVGLRDKAGAYPIRLSGGQQQRVGIARALAMQPKILLFDEPTSALDPELVGEVLQVMLDLARSGVTMVVVTHEMSFARNCCDEVVLLDAGEIVDRGPPGAVMDHSGEARARQFFAAHHGATPGAGR